MPKISRTRKVATVERYLSELQNTGLAMKRAESPNDTELWIDGQRLKNFGSCSYMGLEHHPRLVEGCVAAVRKHGTQFSFSRAYLDSPLYAALETALDEMTDRFCVATPSTSQAHMAALPVLVDDRDVVVIDQFAHASLHMACELLGSTVVERLKHNRIDQLEDKIKAHAPHARHIWYVCDGVYSMLGDLADFDGIEELLARYPQLHVYCDDAHSVSWAGQHGRGSALERLGQHERVIVALSMNKAFSAGGGVLALPSEAMRTKIRRCGGPMLFSGPLQPPMLGAAIASAQLHLEPEFAGLQKELAERIVLAQQTIERTGLVVPSAAHTPIFMVQFDSPRSLQPTLFALRERGYYCCVSTFPAVPMDKPSVRFTVSRHNSHDEIKSFIETLADVVAADEPMKTLNIAV